jgi:hypothetical protein
VPVARFGDFESPGKSAVKLIMRGAQRLSYCH